MARQLHLGKMDRRRRTEYENNGKLGTCYLWGVAVTQLQLKIFLDFKK